jgi:hypothetical protein
MEKEFLNPIRLPSRFVIYTVDYRRRKTPILLSVQAVSS